MIFGKYINKYYLRYSYILLLGIIALVAVDFYQLKIPEIYGQIIDGLKDATLTSSLITSLMGDLLIILAVMVIGRFLWRICFFGSALKVKNKIRNAMFNHVKDLSQQYYQSNKVGSLMALFTNDLDTICECFGDGILMFFDVLCLGSFAIVKMYLLNPILATLSLIPLCILLLIGVVVGKYMMKKWEIRQQAFSDLSDYSQESFSGIAVIKAFVKEARELSAFKKINKQNEKANVDFVKASTLLNVLITLLIQTVTCLIIGYGGYITYKGTFSVGTLMIFLSYFSATIWPMMAISQLIDMTSRGKASMNRISELLDKSVDVVDRDDVIDVETIKGDIEFKHLTFKYPDGEYDVLHDLSFKINAGENVGIIGKTGCGKTTIVDLILRTYNVEDDSLFIDGIDVNKLPIKTVRKHSAYVPQDNFLFSDTIQNNIAFYDESISIEKVKEAARLADVDDNIMEFSEGYSTILGERGVTISGGQKQRTSIARALLKDASILILDDSVSAVDTKTEAIILNNLKESRKGKTTILIAHRITTIERMDKIIFIDDGKVVDIGTHQQLLNRCDEYKKMVALQKLEDETGGNE